MISPVLYLPFAFGPQIGQPAVGWWGKSCNFLDVDATVLNGLDRIGDLQQLGVSVFHRETLGLNTMPSLFPAPL